MELDKRFAKVKNDPRFQRISKKHKKIKIDSRFEKMFSDKRFHTKFTRDKRGKPLFEEEVEDLQKFYEIQPDEDGKDQSEKIESENEHLTNTCKSNKDLKLCREKKSPKELNKKIKGSDQVLRTSKNCKKPVKTQAPKGSKEKKANSSDYIGEKVNFENIRGTLEENNSSEDSDTEDEFDDEIDDGIVHGWGELDEDAKRVENAETSKLAVCNCDWDKITATDLYVLFNSFKPPGGSIISVNIYPSDYGIQRMKEEDLKGPQELKELPNEDKEIEDGSEGSAFHMEKLREYQLNRMKYFYAIVVCDSKETADKIYCECDGMEYEMSATRLDLRFVPDDLSFDDREPKSTATEMPSVNSYTPTKFLNTALQQSTVRLTWDEADSKRVEKTMRQFTKKDVDEMDFKDYLASSSDEEENQSKIFNETASSNDTKNEEEDDKIRKYRLLMKEIESKEKVEDDEGNIEVTWDLGIEETNHQNSNSKGTNDKIKKEKDFVNTANNTEDNTQRSVEGVDDPSLGFDDPFFKNVNDKVIKKKKKSKINETLTEEQLKQKAELELLLMDDESEEKKHFSLKTILKQDMVGKKKKKKRNAEVQPEDSFEVDVNDPRFNALYTSHLYSIDPSEPNFKKTKGTTAIIAESQKRRARNGNNTHKVDEELENNIKTKSLSDLVKSVKTKTMLHQKRKKLK